MSEQIEHIVWHEQHQIMEVAYREREPDHIPTDRQLATMLAEDVGLVLVSSVSALTGMVRWVRNLDS
jgi:hypothetical protein